MGEKKPKKRNWWPYVGIVVLAIWNLIITHRLNDLEPRTIDSSDIASAALSKAKAAQDDVNDALQQIRRIREGER